MKTCMRTPQLRHARQSKEADLRRVFDKLDTKRDKKVDADELMEFFKQCGENIKKVGLGRHIPAVCAPLLIGPACQPHKRLLLPAVGGGRHDLGGRRRLRRQPVLAGVSADAPPL